LEVDEATTLLTETGQVDAAPQGQTGEHASPATPGIASTSPSDRSGRKVPVEGDEPTTLLTEAGQVDAAPQGRAGEHASPATPGVASTSPSGRGGRRVPGPGKKLGRPPSRFTVDGICRRFPQSAERLHRDIVRLAAEEVARRLGVTIANMRKAPAKRKTPGVAITSPSGRGGRRVPGPGKRLGRPTGTHDPRNLPLYLRTLRTELGIDELGDMRVPVPITELSKLLEASGKGPKRRGGRPRQDAKRSRVMQLRSEGKSWRQVQAAVNRETGENLTVDAYRRLARHPPTTKIGTPGAPGTKPYLGFVHPL
jgi:hypothetical protein